MDVVLGAQSLVGEQGGINTYTRQLIRAFYAESSSVDLKLMINNRIIDPNAFAAESPDTKQGDERQKGHYFPGLRARAGYFLRTATLFGQRHALFHETNNLLLQMKTPSVVTIHDLSCLKYPDFHPKKRAELFAEYLPKTVKSADHIITVSETVRSEILEYFGADPSKVTAVPLGIDHIDGPTLSSDRPGRPYFLVIGALEPRKNIGAILAAIDIIGLEKAFSLGIRVLHAGPPGWMNSSFSAAIARASDKGVWEELGTVSVDQLQSLYANATALLYPSVYEGFGIPPFEALLHGCPVVLNDIPVFREFHSQGVLWIEDSNVVELAYVIALLHENRDEAKRLGEEGRHFHSKNPQLTWRETARKTVDVYQIATASKNGRAR